MRYQIYDFRYENEQPILLFDTEFFELECNSVPECIELFRAMQLEFLGEIDEYDQLIIDTLIAGDYKMKIYDENYISLTVYTYKNKRA